MSSSKQRVEVKHRYNASPEAVWEIYVDHAKWSEWAGVGPSRLVTEGSPDRNGVGAVRGFSAGTLEEVLSFDAPKRMTYTLVGGLFPIKNHLGEVTLAADGDGTLLRWRCEFESKIPGLGGLFRRMITKTFTGGLEGLEKHSFS
ncbi:MAG: SRPBCC family protein [bacterium]|jgi:uncharacterized protein YndB with AHSA1/START domain